MRNPQKAMKLIFRLGIILFALLVIAIILTIVFALYLPPYRPGANLFLVRDTYGNEILKIYDLMVSHTQEMGTYDEYHSYYSQASDGWSKEAYEKALALVDQLRSNDGPAIYFADVQFTTLGYGRCAIQLDIDSHGDHLVYLVYAPGSTDDRFARLDDTGDWFYWDYCK